MSQFLTFFAYQFTHIQLLIFIVIVKTISSRVTITQPYWPASCKQISSRASKTRFAGLLLVPRWCAAHSFWVSLFLCRMNSTHLIFNYHLVTSYWLSKRTWLPSLLIGLVLCDHQPTPPCACVSSDNIYVVLFFCTPQLQPEFFKSLFYFQMINVCWLLCC